VDKAGRTQGKTIAVMHAYGFRGSVRLESEGFSTGGHFYPQTVNHWDETNDSMDSRKSPICQTVGIFDWIA